MTQIVQRCWLSFSLLVFAASLLWLTTELGPTARLVPGKVIIPTLALLAIQFVLDLIPRLAAKIADFAQLRLRRVDQLSGEVREHRAQKTPSNSRRMWSDVAWFCSAPALVYLIGLMIAAPLYTLVFLRWHSGETWRTSVSLATAMAVFMFGVFGLILDVTFDEGRIWHWLGG